MTHPTLHYLLIASVLSAGLSTSVEAAEETAPEPVRLDSSWQIVPGPQSGTHKRTGLPIKLENVLTMDAPEQAPLRAHYTPDGQLILSHEPSTETVLRQIEVPK